LPIIFRKYTLPASYSMYHHLILLYTVILAIFNNIVYTVGNTLLYTVLYTSPYFVRFTVLDDILYTNNKVTDRSDLIPKKHFFYCL
jgi:hypothetical protein